MRVRFWGCRGSLPVALGADGVRAKLRAALRAAAGRDLDLDDAAALEAFIDTLPFATRGGYGGNSSCVQIEADTEQVVICDLGSGLRALGQSLVEAGQAGGRQFDIFVSHLHWDHIMGLPFFVPAYIPGNRLRIHGCHPHLEAALQRQQAPPSFPVGMDVMAADIEYVILEPGRWYDIGGLRVLAHLQEHAGDSYGYRFEQGGKSVVYSTDAEHKLESAVATAAFVEFIRAADLVIFDAMYSLADAISVKQDWGHSSNIVGVDLCHRGAVRRYCMTHHEPIHDDATIDRLLAETRRYEELVRDQQALEVLSAYDGLVIEI